jgi:hypothetical protein
MRGPAYLAEAAKTQIDSVLRAGEEAQFATMIANMPAAVAERAKKILDVK